MWYIALGLTAAAEVAYTLYRAEDRRQTFAFYLTLAGMTLWLETFLLIFFKAYAYYPRIVTLPGHAYDDILTGNLFSQFSVAASMLMVAVLRLKPRWYFILALAYGGIEELFVALHIYEQYWYSTWLTVALLPFAFLIARKMYDRLREGLRPAYYYGYVFFSMIAICMVTLWWGLHLADIQAANNSLLSDSQASRYAVILSYFYLVTISMQIVYFSGIRRVYKALIVAALIAVHGVLYLTGLFLIRPGWFLPVVAVTLLWKYGALALVDRLYGLSGGTMMRRYRSLRQ